MKDHTEHFVSRQNHYVHRHVQPLSDTNGKQLSGPHVNKGFLYMEDHTEPLCGQTKPLYTQNTYNHCDTNGKQLSGP